MCTGQGYVPSREGEERCGGCVMVLSGLANVLLSFSEVCEIVVNWHI